MCKYLFIYECTVYYPLWCVAVLINAYAGNNTFIRTVIQRTKAHFSLSDIAAESLVLYLFLGTHIFEWYNT